MEKHSSLLSLENISTKKLDREEVRETPSDIEFSKMELFWERVSVNGSAINFHYDLGGVVFVYLHISITID